MDVQEHRDKDRGVKTLLAEEPFSKELPNPQGLSSPKKNDNVLGLGDCYYIAGGRKAVLLAHSSHEILRDPHRNYISQFPTLDRRILFRLGRHPLRSVFENGLSSTICSIVEQSGLPWTSVGAYRQGFSAEFNVPTVIVMARPSPLSSELYQTASIVADAVESVLMQERDLRDVHVEVAMIDCAEAYASDEQIWSRQDLSRMHDPVWDGASVGPVDQTESGTLSGCVRIEDPASAVVAGKGAGPRADVFGITCHHVASAGREDTLAKITENDAVRLTSPSYADHKSYVAEIEALVQILQKDLLRVEKMKMEMAAVGSACTQRREEDLQSTAAECSTNRAILEHVQACWQQGCGLGTVLLSSGVRMPSPGDSISDWALMQLDPSRMERQTNTEPPISVTKEQRAVIAKATTTAGVEWTETVGFFNDSDSALLGNEAERVLSEDEILSLVREEAPTFVFLRGRTTPFGIGVLHDVCDKVNTRYLQNGSEIVVVSRELTVLNVPSKQQDLRNPGNYVTCSNPGDSGAKVRLDDGRLLGFVVASNRNDQLGRPSTHITMAQTMLDRIADATGARKVSFVGMDAAV